MKLHILSRFFDSEGVGERMENRTLALLREEREGFFLTYADPDKGLPQTELFFKKGTPCVLKMKQPQTEAVFSPDLVHKSLYRIEGVGEMDFCVTTRALTYSLSEEEGGEARLDYEALLGGVRRRTVMTLSLTPKEKEDSRGDN